MNREYLIALPVEEMPEGATYAPSRSLPLHCTAMQWFRLESQFDRARLFNEMMLAALGPETPYIELVSEAREFFGPNREVPCHVLARNEDLNLLHTELFMRLSKAQCSFLAPLAWLGAGYRPHVSDAEGRSFPIGSRHRATSMALVERNAERRRIVRAVYQFGELPF